MAEKKLIGRSLALIRLKKDMKLSKIQREILVGLLLGDGHLQKNGLEYRFIWGQGQTHLEYAQSVYEIWAPLCLSPPNASRSAAILQRFSSLSLQIFRFYARLFYPGKTKRIRGSICRYLTPRGLAYWYMDDGSRKSKQSKGLILNTQGFTEGECETLCQCLENKWGISCWPRPQRDYKTGVLRVYYQIYISGYSFEKMESLIGPYLLEGMRYKWPPPRKRRMNKKGVNINV